MLDGLRRLLRTEARHMADGLAGRRLMTGSVGVPTHSPLT